MIIYVDLALVLSMIISVEQTKNRIIMSDIKKEGWPEVQPWVSKEIELQIQANEDAAAERRKNHDFTMIFDMEGTKLLAELSRRSGQAAALFYQLLPYLSHTGAVIASTTTLASLAGKPTSAISRYLRIAENVGVIARGRSKGLPIIAINPQVAWRGRNTGKQYATFYALVLAEEGEIEGEIEFKTRRGKAIMAYAKKRKGKARTADPELPPPVGQAADECEVME